MTAPVEVAAFRAYTHDEVARLVLDAESRDGIKRWVLFVKRGSVDRMVLHDGVLARVRVQSSGPEPPYEGYLFAYRGECECDLERKLRHETAALGTYNLVASPAGFDDPVAAVAPAFWR